MKEMLFEQVKSIGLAQYSYVVGKADEALVVDPRRDVEVYLDLAARQGYRIRYVLETHRNEDYLTGSLELAARTGAEIWHADAQLNYQYGQGVEDGQTWRIGGLTMEAMHAPGHTEGSMAYVLQDTDGRPWMVFTGDALFAGDVGRTDLLGEQRLAEMTGRLYHTLFDKILPLGDEVMVCPAHGVGSACGTAQMADRPLTTIGIERRSNSMLATSDKTEFVANAARVLERPPYFRTMERLNLSGPPISGAVPIPTPLTVAEFDQARAECRVIDTRMELGFNAAHVPGSLFLWVDGLSHFAGWFLDYNRPLLLVGEEASLHEVSTYLYRIGFDQVRGYLSGGMRAWHTSGRESDGIGMVSVKGLCRLLDEEAGIWLLDVRAEEEIAAGGAIPGAHNIHLTQLPLHLGEIPTDRPIYLFCGSGMRSTIAASILRNHGLRDLIVVRGGTSGWSSTKCPLQ